MELSSSCTPFATVVKIIPKLNCVLTAHKRTNTDLTYIDDETVEPRFIKESLFCCFRKKLVIRFLSSQDQPPFDKWTSFLIM